MSRLYIIGNGFDLFHGLPTRTSDFCDILSNQIIPGEFENAYEVFYNYGVDWGKFENSLSNIDPEVIEEGIVDYPDYLSDYESDREGVIFNTKEYLNSLSTAINNSLLQLAKTANVMLYKNKIHKKIRNIKIGKDDYIVSFNYTSTLEALYCVDESKIIHIHGNASKGEMLVFGYKDDINTKRYNKLINTDSDDRDYYIDEQRFSIVDFCRSWKKSIRLKELKVFLDKIGVIDEVFVLGHSMSDVDREYMELIEQIINPISWNISQYDNKPNIKDLQEYSFINKISFFTLE